MTFLRHTFISAEKHVMEDVENRQRRSPAQNYYSYDFDPAHDAMPPFHRIAKLRTGLWNRIFLFEILRYRQLIRKTTEN